MELSRFAIFSSRTRRRLISSTNAPIVLNSAQSLVSLCLRIVKTQHLTPWQPPLPFSRSGPHRLLFSLLLDFARGFRPPGGSLVGIWRNLYIHATTACTLPWWRNESARQCQRKQGRKRVGRPLRLALLPSPVAFLVAPWSTRADRTVTCAWYIIICDETDGAHSVLL